MRFLNRVLAYLVLITLLFTIIPIGAIIAFAEEALMDEYTIDNSYIQITMKKDGSSYGIDTLEGHPLKKYDDDNPLLYDKNDYLATSYTTIRIEKNGVVKDYVFGSKKGILTKAPEIVQADTGIQSIQTVWEVDEVAITQDLIINSDTSLVEAGYADVKYSYTNVGTEDVKVGVRILLDTKIANNDGGNFFVNGKNQPISTETVLTGDEVPEWYRISDNSYFSTTTAFGLLKNDGMRTPDSIQMGHWFNLANTLWSFNPNTSLDFADSYNQYLFADSAIALLWNPENVPAGGTGSCDAFFGIGDLSGTELMQDSFIVNVTQKAALEVNGTKTGYLNDGEVLLYVSIDNSDPKARKLVDTKIKLEFEGKKVDVDTGEITQEPAIWVPSGKTEDELIYIGDIEAGAIKSNIPIKLKAKPVYYDDEDNISYDVTNKPAPIDTKKITLNVYDNDNINATIASKIICMPSLGAMKPDIGFLDVSPRIVNYKGPAYVSVKGMGENFSVLRDKSLWSAYFRNVVTDEIVYVDSFKTTVDTENNQLGLVFDLQGKAGSYELNIEFKGSLEGLGTFAFSDHGKYVLGSTDEKYKNRGYSIAVISRVDDKAHYDMRLFTSNESKTAEEQFKDYKKKLDENDGEILIETRGLFKVTYRDDYKNPTADEVLSVKNYNDNNEKSNSNIKSFVAEKGSDPVKINRILYYDSTEPLSINANYNGDTLSDFTLSGNGKLSVINASTIWKDKFKIEILAQSMIYSYDDVALIGMMPKLELEGSGYLLQNLGGMIVDLQYGVLGCDGGNYTISFGGSIAIPLGFNKEALASNSNKNGKGNTGTGAASTTGTPPPSSDAGTATGGSSGSDTPGATKKSSFGSGNATTKKAADVFEDAGQLSVSIDSILYGEHENTDNSELIENGFIGVAVTANIELPARVFPAGAKESKNKTVENGAKAANPSEPSGSVGSPTTKEGQQANKKAGTAKKRGGPLSAFELGFNFNTYDFYVGVDMAIKMGKISSAFRIGFTELSSGKTMLDAMYFEVSGFRIDVWPGVMSINGLGGGFSDLAASIENSEDTLPLTIYLMIMADIVRTVYLRGDVAVSASGMDVTIQGAPKKYEEILMKGDLSVNWQKGFTLGATGTIQMYDDVIIGAVSFGYTDTPESVFMGKIIGTVQIPGLGSVGSAMLVFTDEYIGGGVKALIFSGGVMYYFDSKKFRFLSSSEIDVLEEIDFDKLKTNDPSAEVSSSDSGDSGSSDGLKAASASGKMIASSGIKTKAASFLEVREVMINEETGETAIIALGQGAKAVSTSIKKYGLLAAAGSGLLYLPLVSDYQYDFTIESEFVQSADKDIVVRIDYAGDTKPQLTLTSPYGSYKLEEFNNALSQEDNNAKGANLMWAERKKDDGTTSKYAYISIPVDKLVAGVWSVKSENNIKIVSGTKFTLPSMLATISNVLASKDANNKLDVTWKAPEDTLVTVALVPCDENGDTIKQIIYDENGVPIKNADGTVMQIENTGYILAQNVGYQDYLTDFPIPSVLPSGEYIVRVDGVVSSSIFISGYSIGKIDYTNPNTLAVPIIKEVIPIGNGTLKVVAELPPNATGLNCNIYKKTTETVNGLTGVVEEKLKGIGGYAGDYDGDGIVTAYFSGGVDILDDTGAVRLREEITPGDMYKVTAYALNNDEGTSYLRSADVDSSAYVTIPVPDKPEVLVNIKAGNSSQKTSEKGVKYVQTDSEDFLIEYEITNAYDSAGIIKEAFKKVDVQIVIDNIQYGETLHNVYDETEGMNNTNAFKGFAYTNLTDGEHFIELIATNADGDRSIVTNKTAIDSIASDLKISSPTSGAYLNPNNGVEIDLITDLGTDLVITIDGVSVGSIPKNQIAADGSFKATYSLTALGLDSNNYSYDVKIKATDSLGNSTQYFATVINEALKRAEGIKIKAVGTSGSGSIELYAIAMDGSNNELLKLPKELLKWTLMGGEGGTSLVVSEGNSSAVLTPGYEGADYAVKAEWNIAPGFSFDDVYVSNIVGEKPQEGQNPTDGDPVDESTTYAQYPDHIKTLLNKLKGRMSPSAEISAFKMYADVNSKSEVSDNVIYVPGNLIPTENYIIIGADKNVSGYSGMLGSGIQIVSDVIEFVTERKLSKFSITLPYDKSKITDDSDLGIYKFIKGLNKWLYINGEINKVQDNARLISMYPGRYAILENTNKTMFTDVSGRWSEGYVKALGIAGLVNGLYEQEELVFKPENNITRGEFIKILVAAKGLEVNNTDVSMFADSSEFADWMFPYAAAAVREGWLKGIKTPDGLEARLNDAITREDAMVLVYRVFFDSLKAQGRNSFFDSAEVSSYAYDAVNYLTSTGVLNGFEDNTVRPKQSISREQTAKIMHGCIIIGDTIE